VNREARLVVGPLLRYTGTESATVWMETDVATEVEVLGHRARTFHVEGHHYALVRIGDLEPGTVTPYDVRIGGVTVWPPRDGRPHCAIHTREFERQSRIVFGSCRVGAPQRPPYTRPPSELSEGVGVDALWIYSKRLQSRQVPWPDALLLLGDQVYADEVPPETAAYIHSRRDPTKPPKEEIADFEEYTLLYRESWADPDIRWLLSTVPSTMIFDDHDVNDDWNISQTWVDEMRARPWWKPRISGAFMSYWLYQHLGNLSPPELAEDELFKALQEDEDAGPRLRRFAEQCDRESASSRWAYYRDFGRSRLLVIDSRAARVLTDGRRDMIDAGEWEWIVEHCRGSFDHLILASTLPVFMASGLHYLEALSEAVCSGAWGSYAARLGERVRRLVDLEHWPAFQSSFRLLVDLLGDLAREDDAPATIVLLGGDVHCAYVAEIHLAKHPAAGRVYQIVCSPFRNPLTPIQRKAIRLSGSRLAAGVLRRVARRSGIPAPEVSWHFTRGPTFENSIGELELDERAARVTIRAATEEGGEPRLKLLHDAYL
jgi:hypothetical protein